MAVTKIRVPAHWTPNHPSGGGPAMRYDIAEFTLGVGPCGKLVEKLDYELDFQALHVYQECADGESKTFIYPIHTLTGRIEITENSS